jgi:amino acid transporter
MRWPPEISDPRAGLVVAAALLVDYVMTVAVSVAAGVDNIISAIPELNPYRVVVNIGFIVVLTAMNLRGVRESGRAFAVPTYAFIVGVMAMIGIGLVRTLLGDAPQAESAHYGIHAEQSGLNTLAIALLALRAFSSGCTALTGVEAISNGVPAFRKPKALNAARTMSLMGALAITMFAGVTALALIAHTRVVENPCDLIGFPGDCNRDAQRTVIAQIAAAVFGNNSVMFYYLQAATALILILAANTAYNGFPLLSSILAGDRYLPRQLHTRGDRLAYSNGIILLAVIAGGLIYVFDGSTTRLIQLYILGVFTSFTLCQTGMVWHWNRELRDADTRADRLRIPPRAGHQRIRRLLHRGRLGGGDGDQVHPRRLSGGDRDPGVMHRDAGNTAALRSRAFRTAHRRRRRASPAEQGARHRARLELAQAHSAGAHVRARDQSRHPDRTDRERRRRRHQGTP